MSQAELDPVPHHAGGDGVLGVEDGAVSGGAGAVHASRLRVHDRRGDRRTARPPPAGDRTTFSTRSSRCGSWSGTGTGATAAIATRLRPRRSWTRRSPTYIGGILEMCNARLYRFWADLTEALQTGKPQNEIKHTGKPMFDELYSDPARLEQFMEAMQGISLGNFHALAEKFDFSKYETLCDVGGATGQLCTILAGAPSASSVHELRPPGRRADRGEGHRRRGPDRPRSGRLGRLLRGSASPRRTSSRWA